MVSRNSLTCISKTFVWPNGVYALTDSSYIVSFNIASL